MDASRLLEEEKIIYRKHPFTREEYHRMEEAHTFGEKARIELINGEIYEMSPINSSHSGVVNRLNRLLNRLLGEAFIVSIQNPVVLGLYSEPEPDIAILNMRKDYYAASHPGPEDVRLIIEVADTSLEKDRKIKLPQYAKAGIPEVWILNIKGQSLEIYRSPSGTKFKLQNTYKPEDVIETQLLDSIAVKDLFPDKNIEQ